MSDTSALDDKKTDHSIFPENFASNLVGFLTSLLVFILIVFIYFSGSGVVLYMCKLAQSNILPTEESCYPYTDSKPTIQPIKTNIFTTFTDELSNKLVFPYDEYNTSDKMLDMFREYKQKSSSHFLGNYFISIMEKIMSFNYATINTVMNSLNSIPETILVLLGPLMSGLLFAMTIVLNWFYIVYLWFANMAWFFKTNTNDSGDGLPEWESVSVTDPLNFGLGIGLVILFSILFFVGAGVWIFMPFFVLSYCYLSCMMYKGLLDGKKATSFTIIKDVFKYYKLSIVGIISAFVVLLAFSKLGTMQGIFSLVVIGLIYGGIISFDIFQPIQETNLTPLVSYKQATKKCISTKVSTKKHGFLYNLIMGKG